VATLKYVGTANWNRERLNMPVNTPASWSAHVLRMWRGMSSGPAALQGLTRLNVLLTAATEKESSTVLGNRPCQWHCVILKLGEEGV
jgi:hypothetical protein